jgi:hypothetical protein
MLVDETSAAWRELMAGCRPRDGRAPLAFPDIALSLVEIFS